MNHDLPSLDFLPLTWGFQLKQSSGAGTTKASCALNLYTDGVIIYLQAQETARPGGRVAAECLSVRSASARKQTLHKNLPGNGDNNETEACGLGGALRLVRGEPRGMRSPKRPGGPDWLRTSGGADRREPGPSSGTSAVDEQADAATAEQEAANPAELQIVDSGWFAADNGMVDFA